MVEYTASHAEKQAEKSPSDRKRWPVRAFDAQQFVDHYQANGWMAGRNKMKDWKASVRNWGARDFGGASLANQPPGQTIDSLKDDEARILQRREEQRKQARAKMEAAQ